MGEDKPQPTIGYQYIFEIKSGKKRLQQGVVCLKRHVLKVFEDLVPWFCILVLWDFAILDVG